MHSGLRRLADTILSNTEEIDPELLREDWAYDSLKKIGQGGAGTVFLATQDFSARAIKILRPKLALRQEFLISFQQEADMLRRLGGIHTPKLLKTCTRCARSGYHYYEMEEIQGSCLARLLACEEYFDPNRTARIGIAVCEAMSFFQSKGIIHRDIKPGNIVLDESKPDGRVYIIDFGMAYDESLVSPFDCSLVGTPSYTAPEHCANKADIRSDIYSLGITLWQLQTGKLPFCLSPEDGDSFLDMIEHAHRNSQLKQFGIPDELYRVICKATAKNPVDRYQTTEEFIADLANTLV